MHRCYQSSHCRFNRCNYSCWHLSNLAFLWVLSSCFALLGLFTSSLWSRRVHLTNSLVPLIALSFDHQNHSKWSKWGPCSLQRKRIRGERKAASIFHEHCTAASAMMIIGWRSKSEARQCKSSWRTLPALSFSRIIWYGRKYGSFYLDKCSFF